LVEDESSVEAFKDFTIDDAGGAKSAAQPAEAEKPKEEPKEEMKEEMKEPKQSSEPQKEEKSTSSSSVQDFGGAIHASPIARRLALEHGIPLKKLKGTGPSGRIIKSDIERYLSSAAGSTAAAAPQIPKPQVVHEHNKIAGGLQFSGALVV
jgi:pyruvate dehydrogenase E2 component (dihydrolipoamide acetyltransferase)